MRRGAQRATALLISTSIAIAAMTVSTAMAGPEILSVRLIVTGPSPFDRFVRPMGLAADSARGLFVVADTGAHRLAFFDVSGRSRGSLPCTPDPTGSSAGEPRAVALDPSGRLYVLDGVGRGVEIRTATGARLALLDPAPVDSAGTRPQGVAVGASGRIYLVYAGDVTGLLVVEPRGTQLETVLRVGFDATSPFVGPTAVAVNADETAIAVVDPQAPRAVTVLDAGGRVVAAFGRHGDGEGAVSMPSYVTWGPGETLWVVDQIRHSISVFASDGTFRGRIGGFGGGPGQFDYPIACTFLAPDRLAVLERAGARLQVLEVDVGNGPGAGDPGPGSIETGTLGVSGADPAGAAATDVSGWNSVWR